MELALVVLALPYAVAAGWLVVRRRGESQLAQAVVRFSVRKEGA